MTDKREAELEQEVLEKEAEADEIDAAIERGLEGGEDDEDVDDEDVDSDGDEPYEDEDDEL